MSADDVSVDLNLSITMDERLADHLRDRLLVELRHIEGDDEIPNGKSLAWIICRAFDRQLNVFAEMVAIEDLAEQEHGWERDLHRTFADPWKRTGSEDVERCVDLPGGVSVVAKLTHEGVIVDTYEGGEVTASFARTYGEFSECTSTDPTDHQGDTCPVHEDTGAIVNEAGRLRGERVDATGYMNPAYPNGQCPACGQGCDEHGRCQNDECGDVGRTVVEVDATDPRIPVVIQTVAIGNDNTEGWDCYARAVLCFEPNQEQLIAVLLDGDNDDDLIAMIDQTKYRIEGS